MIEILFATTDPVPRDWLSSLRFGVASEEASERRRDRQKTKKSMRLNDVALQLLRVRNMRG